MNISMEHVTAIVNGHTCEGWAADAGALTLPDLTMANVETGADGLALFSSTGMKGGVVTYKFMASSVSRKQFQRWMTQIVNGAVIEFEGSIAHAQTGESISLARGAMLVAPFGTTIGNTTPAAREFQIHYERITPNFDSFKATPLFAAATSAA